MAGDVRDGLQLFAPLPVAAAGGHVIGKRRIAQNMALGGFQQDQHRLIKIVLRVPLTHRFHLRHQRGEAVFQQARVVDDDMSLAFIGLVDAKNLRADGGLHFIGHLGVDEVLHRAIFPVGEQHFAVDALIFFADVEAVLRAGRELVQLLEQPVGIHLRRHDPGARLDRTVTGNQFIITNRNLHMIEDPCGRFRPADHHRLPLGLFMAGGVEQRSLEGDFARVGEQTIF